MTQQNTITLAVDPDEMFPQVEKMLYSLAHKTADLYPVTFDEAKAEAYFAFVKACHDFNPDKVGANGKTAKFSTWCYFWVWTHLKTWITKRSVDPITFQEMNEELCGEALPERSPSLELVDGFSDDAKEIISLLLETPAELLGWEAITPKQLLARVKDYMIQQGHDKRQVELAHREIITTFRQAWAV